MNTERGLIDFYPTPDGLIAKLVAGIKFSDRMTFLEPSGGKGNICDYIKTAIRHHSYHGEINIDVIEINPDLQHVIKGKEHRLVHDDFLTFDTRKAYDYIVANFPFSEDDKHLDKALRLLDQNGGELRCIVNAQTLRNPNTRLRQSIATTLDHLNAEVEYLTQEFESAERKTSVEIALIKVKADSEGPFSLILESMQRAQEVQAATAGPQGLVESDFIGAFTARYRVECDLGIKLINEYSAMQPYIQDKLHRPGEEKYSSPLLKLELAEHSYSRGRTDQINGFLRGVREKYWGALIHDPRFNSQYTSNILSDLDRKLKELRDYDFTGFNIRELQKEMQSKVIQGVEDAIMKLFDDFSHKYAYWDDCTNGNLHYYNGWKTNKAHKIGRKIIIPINGLRAEWSGKGSKMDYHMHDKLNDMVKVFNYLSRDKVDVPRLVGNCITHADNTQNFALDLRFFETKFYKKGTCHITFKDAELLEKFNIFGSQRKNWLPPSYGKVAYEAMGDEGKRVIDEFQGKDEYNKVMRNADYYLVDTSTLLLTEGNESEFALSN